jgi:hypothetical protein
MAQIVVYGDDAVQIQPRPYYKIEGKFALADEWRLIPYAVPVECTLSIMPAIDQATGYIDYGRIKREDKAEFVNSKPRNLKDLYIKISAGYEGYDWFPIWTGIITETSFAVAGDKQVLNGRQSFTARGLGHLLEREPMNYSYWDKASDFNVTDPQALRRYYALLSPVFNPTSGGGVIVGNRTADNQQREGDSGTSSALYSFSNAEGSVKWRASDIVFYVAKMQGFQIDQTNRAQPELPDITFTGGLAAQVLEEITPTIDTARHNRWSILNEVIRRERGINGRLVWDGGSVAEIRIGSEVAKEIKVGDVTIPANTRQQRASLTAARYLSDLNLREANDTDPAVIVVSGAPIRVTFTAERKRLPLKAAWRPEDEDKYVLAGQLGNTGLIGGNPGWSSMSTAAKADVADTIRRNNPEFRNVYRRFGLDMSTTDRQPFVLSDTTNDPLIDYSLNFTSAGAPDPTAFKARRYPVSTVIPNISTDGTFYPTDQTRQGPRKVVTRFLRQTGILASYDYSQGDAPVYIGTEFDRPEALPPRVFAYVNATVSGQTIPRWYDITKRTDDTIPTANLSVSDDGLFFTLDSPNSPHAFANALPLVTQFTPGENGQSPSKFQPVEILDFRATLAIETPYSASVAFSNADRPKGPVVQINVPDAELWWIPQGTIVGIDDSNTFVRVSKEGGIFTRDDRPLLRTILALAVSYYATPRASFSFSFAGIGGTPSPGDMITDFSSAVGVALPANAVVDSVTFSFGANGFATRCTGAPAALDFVRLASSFTPSTGMAQGTPSGTSAARGGGGARGGGVGRIEGLPVSFAEGSPGTTTGATSGTAVWEIARLVYVA